MTIGIFTAMHKEAVSFLKGDYVTETYGAYTFYKFNLGKHNAVLCCPPSVGEIAASSACQLLITKYGASCILNFGIVGALTEQIALQSYVLVGSVTHYDMDTSQADDLPAGFYGCFNSTEVSAQNDLLSRAVGLLGCPVVKCASADKFVAVPADKQALHANFNADVCDMESAGILFTCKFNEVPCLMVKCISDSLFGGKQEYWSSAEDAAQGFMNFALRLVEVL